MQVTITPELKKNSAEIQQWLDEKHPVKFVEYFYFFGQLIPVSSLSAKSDIAYLNLNDFSHL